MVKIVFCLRKLSHLTTEQFQRHWLDIHAPVVRKHHQVLRIARYVQFHSDFGPMEKKLRAFRNSPEPTTELRKSGTKATLATLGKNSEARAASRELLEDEKRFVDHSRSPIWLGHEKAIIPTEGNGRGILP
jgi:EthD domain